MIGCMLKEINLRKAFLEGDEIESIYFGGGTPSILSTKQIANLLNELRRNFSVTPNAEITLEANPEDISEQFVNELHKNGFNRISLGVQSFNDSILENLNRSHKSYDAETAIKILQNTGISNVSIDLIYGIPNQSAKEWEKNLDKAVALNVPHISCYALTIEDRTVFGNWLKKGKLESIPDEKYESDYNEMCTVLKSHKFEHYEISNFARPGFKSQHNTSYWEQKPYLGIGPGAHSYNHVSRQYNIENNASYIRSLKVDRLPYQLEELTPVQKLNEYLLTGLRTNNGIDFEFIKSEFKVNLLEIKKEFIDQYVSDGRVVFENGKLVVRESALLMVNSIIVELMMDEEDL